MAELAAGSVVDEKAGTRSVLRWLRQHFEVRQNSKFHIPSMEGMRGFAMLLIFWAHYFGLSQPWLLQDSRTSAVGGFFSGVASAAVSLFFLISGYAIYGALIRKPFSMGGFLFRRLQRIYPPFATVLAIYLVLSFMFPEKSKLPADPVASTVYVVQNLLLLPGIFQINPIISVAWTLSYELFFYISAPILVTLLRLQTWESVHRVFLFLLLTAMVFAYSIAYRGPVDLAMFLSGMILYETITRKPNRWVEVGGTLALVVGLMLAYLIEPRHIASIPRTAVVFVAFYIVCFSGFSNNGLISRVFAWTPLRWLGNMSYSYYLLHGLMLQGMFYLMRIVAPPPAAAEGITLFWLFLPVALVITITGSALLYLGVEKPFSLARLPLDRVTRAMVPAVVRRTKPVPRT